MSTATVNEKWDVITNPAKKDSTDPAFLVREVSGFPIALCWSRDKADRIAARRMFLVSLGCTMDDFPCGLFATKEEAEAFALTVDTEFVDGHPVANLGRDASTALNVHVTEFANGVPVDNWTVRHFTD